MSFIGVGIGVAALGVGANVIGAVKAGKAAKDMRLMADQTPEAVKSKYPGLMLATATNELNANNPFLASENRAIQGVQASQTAAASKAVTDPTMLLSMVNAYSKNAQDATFKNSLANYQMRQQKVSDVYNAQRAGQQQDQMNYDNQMTRFNSQANLRNAAAQTTTAAWQNVGNSLIGAGTSIATAGMKPKTPKV